MKEGSDSVSAQRFRIVAARIAFDLGGHENLTEAQQQLVRRCRDALSAVRIDGGSGA